MYIILYRLQEQRKLKSKWLMYIKNLIMQNEFGFKWNLSCPFVYFEEKEKKSISVVKVYYVYNMFLLSDSGPS
jgi:hypothetical protein